MTEPKIAPLGSCYNYKKLKKEGLVDKTKEGWTEEDDIRELDDYYE